MGKLVNYITQLHKSTKRLYIERMQDNKVTCMIEAKKYDFNYWDGDRRYGYGGYKFKMEDGSLLLKFLLKIII